MNRRFQSLTQRARLTAFAIAIASFACKGGAGSDGAAGPQGLPGPPGPAGATGPQGPQGPVGATGPAGAIGPTGPQGSQGVGGSTGPAGPQGLQGPAGAAGPRGLAWLGTWSAVTTYAIGDAVEHEGSAYVAVAPSTAVAPPSAEWELLASAGATGPAGPQGPPGPAGNVVFGTTAGTAAEGNDARLSDARDPRPGSAAYIQADPASPQAAGLSISGGGAFGGAVTAARFVGDGAGLTSLSAASLTGTVPDASLAPSLARLDRDNTFSGANAFRDPVSPSDAATKQYVDASVAAARSGVFLAEQTTSIQVVAHSWTAVPGATVSFTAAAPRFASFLASGSVEGVDPGAAVGTCGFRFVVDGVGSGDATWGDRLVQCGAASWCAWAMQRMLSLPAGPHSVAVEAIGLGSTGCFMGGGSYSNVKLFLTTY